MGAKVESGEASSYGEAEKLVEQGGIELSVDGLKRVAGDLKLKVEAAKLQKEKDVEQKLSDRESLIGESRRNEELLVTAREALDYFTSMSELGQLDKDDTKRLEELQTLVSSLENQGIEIEKKITIISDRPEILEKLKDAAQKEDVEKTVKSLIEQAHAELDPQIDQLAAEIRDLALRKAALQNSISAQETTVFDSREKIRKIFDDTITRLDSRSGFGYALREIFRNSGSAKELRQHLAEARKSLGMFKGKEKAAIDFILIRSSLELDEYGHAGERFSSLKQQQESLEGEDPNLAERLKTIMGKSWEIQEKISELGSFAVYLPSNLNFRLKDHMEKFADLQRSEGGREVGKHRGWFNATQTIEGRLLYDTWRAVEKAAGGIERNPNKAKQENKE